MPPPLLPPHLQDALGDRYAIERELGRGGMGSVWLARDLHLDRPVAIKLLHPQIAAEPAGRDRFLREARTAAQLAHPHIVPVFSVEIRGDTAFLVMAMIDGESLGARIRRRGPLPLADVERLLREVGWALGYAHSRGVVHRDITPENVLIERETGRALLVDFGLAHAASDGSGPVLGTPGYLAPEVIRGEAASGASDLYALGATAWLALTGAPPYSGDTAGELLAKHLVQPLPALPASAQGASRRLGETLRSCLAKAVEERPADAAALLAMLDRSPPPVAVAPALAEWFTRWERIRPGYAIATPILALQLLLLMEAYLERGGSVLQWAAVASWLFATVLVPATAQLAAELASLSRLASRGFGIGDIRTAWEHWTAGQRQAYRREGIPPLAGRVLFDLTVVGVAVIAIGFVLAATLIPALVAPTEVIVTRYALLSLGSWIFLGTAAGLSINFLAPGIRLNPDGRVRRMARSFWQGPVAGLLARVARGTVRGGTPSTTLHRNTELVLGLAIETLWKALPGDRRDDHADVPAVAVTLQRAAEELRLLRTALTDAQEQLPLDHPEWSRLERTVADIAQQHREAITRLESLRLHLLRAVSLGTMTADLSAEIAAARDAERMVLRGVAGAQEARNALGRPPRRDPLRQTPTPSPALS